MFGSWVSKVLYLIPDSFSSLGLSLERTWLMHEKLFCSCSYPSRHWSAMNTPWIACAAEPFSFCYRSIASVGGRAGSPLLPCLGTNKIRCFVVLRAEGSAFIVVCAAGYKWSRECTKAGCYIERARTCCKDGGAAASLRLGLDLGDRQIDHMVSYRHQL